MKLRSVFALLVAVAFMHFIHAAPTATTTSRLITETTEHENAPVVGGDFVVFQRAPFVGAPTSVVLYDLVNNFEIVLGPGDQPHTDGRTVVWHAKTTLGDTDIHVYDIEGHVEVTLVRPDDQRRPSVAGDVIAFDDVTVSDSDVVVLHLPSGAEARVFGGGPAPDFLNDLDANRVAYTSSSSGVNADIWVFEFTIEEAGGTTTILGSDTQVTTDPAQQSDPSIDGDIVVFSDNSTGNLDVRYVDLHNIGTDVLVGSGAGNQRLHSVSGGRIVYSDDAAPGGSVVYVYDIATATSAPLEVVTPGNEFDPSIDGQFIAYEARGTTSSDIGVAELESAEEFHFGGFLPPVDPLPTFNSMKAGAAVAVKFSLAGDRGLQIFTVGYPRSHPTSCEEVSVEDAVEATVTAGNSSLTYDAATDQYSYIWKTDRAWAGTCRQLVLRFIDDSEARANFTFR